ncbi:hypothetical protein [Zhouia amylolytica]|uniref:hypothetical protein n=1 Tax=Zhouia amylolytica TaxID=376730 RepID=UPI0020CEF15F|nr:hypothetical protein [Zhouia amylolytica]MCQ0112136.1 hypothetical protein [Zhouia amylolytica]
MTRFRKILIGFSLLMMATAGLSGQNSAIKRDLIELPKEKLYVHHNSNMILTGEPLYYAVYNLKMHDHTLSEYSKIAYIELINDGSDVVHRQKVRLNGGKGFGDFIIPMNLTSGPYKLIAYTRMALNNGWSSVFQSDIAIINPYNDNQNKIISNDSITDISQQSKAVWKDSGNNTLLELNKKKYAKREQVKLMLKIPASEISNYSFSISVKKVDSLFNGEMNDIKSEFEQVAYNNSTYDVKTIIELPELRGELITGSIKNNENPGSGLYNIQVGLSIPDPVNPIINVASTNINGEFFFNINREYDSDKAFLEVLSKDAKSYEIAIDHANNLNYDELQFKDFKINENSYSNLLERSVNNQIENSYIDVKKDSLIALKKELPFFGSEYIQYNLDDYTRFKTVKETVIEFIEGVRLRSDGDNSAHFEVREEGEYNYNNVPGLLIVDGAIITNHNNLIDYDSRRIEKINVIRDRFYYGGQVYNGIIYAETFDGNFYNTISLSNWKRIQLFPVNRVKNYNFPLYSNTGANERIPDYRNQLFWNPDLQITETNEVVFYTSDLDGLFEVVLEGVAQNGELISMKTYLKVE